MKNVFVVYTSPTQNLESGSLSKKILDYILLKLNPNKLSFYNLDIDSYFHTPLTCDNFKNYYDNKADLIISKMKEADLIIIATPTVNLTIPSLLKNFFDKVVQSKKTFYYSENGPVGLLNKKSKLLVINTQGSPEFVFSQTISYIINQFNFLGIENYLGVGFYGTDLPGIKELSWEKLIEKYNNEISRIFQFLEI